MHSRPVVARRAVVGRPLGGGGLRGLGGLSAVLLATLLIVGGLYYVMLSSLWSTYNAGRTTTTTHIDNNVDKSYAEQKNSEVSPNLRVNVVPPPSIVAVPPSPPPVLLQDSKLAKIIKKHRTWYPSDHPVTYTDAGYRAEEAALNRLAFEMKEKGDDEGVRLSLLLMSRPGHRTRLVDLIGGAHLSPSTAREQLQRARRFLAVDRRAPRHELTRDYAVDPLHVRKDRVTCESVPCRSCAGAQTCDVDGNYFTMENVAMASSEIFAQTIIDGRESPDAHRRTFSTTRLESQIPVPYFSWHDFGVLEPVKWERKERFAAAFVSNCGFAKRNNMISSLAGLLGKDKVHSYGACVHNFDEPSTSRDQGGKVRALTRYKFSLAFENSETKDYVTEKLFGSLCSGAIPIVIGAPNVKFFAPDTTPYPYESNAVLHARDYGDSPEVIARLLQDIAADDEAYREALRYKTVGYNDDFRALMDLTDRTSDCRACISIGDLRRRKFGPNAYDRAQAGVGVDDEESGGAGGGGGGDSRSLFVRERGNYSFTRLLFSRGEKLTMALLVRRTLERIRPREKNLWVNNNDRRNLPPRVYGYYTVFTKIPILTDADVASLAEGAEVEMIFV